MSDAYGLQPRHDYLERGVTVGFFTDPTVCIGCKACEVACKEWNQVPEDGLNWSGRSYDNTLALSHSTWRHVLFLERDVALAGQVAGPMSGNGAGGAAEDPFSWVFLSDVCKHCELAGCLEACPTGSIVRTGTGTVYVQDDVCNGCGYCVVSCPFGVIDRRPGTMHLGGGAFKCTFCYDRQRDGLEPACAKTCPTDSIVFGPLDEMRDRARKRLAELHGRGLAEARLYDPQDTSVGGIHSVFLVLGDPQDYGLALRPEVPTIYLRGSWTSALVTALGLLALTFTLFLLG